MSTRLGMPIAGLLANTAFDSDTVALLSFAFDTASHVVGSHAGGRLRGRYQFVRCDADDGAFTGHTSPYRFRKILPEPVFGQIKQARGFRQDANREAAL